jgi:uncharacterized protein DUF4154
MALLGCRATIRFALLAVTLGMSSIRAETGPALDEYQVKAAFLFNFAKFVEWPATAFKDGDEPIRICVLGRDPFGASLESLVRGKFVGNRGFVIREVSNAPAARQCSILFVGASERKRTRSILSDLKDASVLTVGETEDFIPNGGVIAFRVDDARIRVEVDRDAAERAKLRISSKLLSLAQRARR